MGVSDLLAGVPSFAVGFSGMSERAADEPAGSAGPANVPAFAPLPKVEPVMET